MPPARRRGSPPPAPAAAADPDDVATTEEQFQHLVDHPRRRATGAGRRGCRLVLPDPRRWRRTGSPAEPRVRLGGGPGAAPTGAGADRRRTEREGLPGHRVRQHPPGLGTAVATLKEQRPAFAPERSERSAACRPFRITVIQAGSDQDLADMKVTEATRRPSSFRSSALRRSCLSRPLRRRPSAVANAFAVVEPKARHRRRAPTSGSSTPSSEAADQRHRVDPRTTTTSTPRRPK